MIYVIGWFWDGLICVVYLFIYIFYDNFLSSDQDTNQFWCKQGLNPRSPIQLSEILPVELTGSLQDLNQGVQKYF